MQSSLNQNAPSSLQMRDGNKKKSHHTTNILLVDEEAIILDALYRFLTKCGFNVKKTTTGKSARELMMTEVFDIVVTEIDMTEEAMGGIELLAHIKRHHPSTLVILTTSFASMNEMKAAETIGADGFLAKPFKGQELLKLIEKIRDIESLNFEKNIETDQDDQYSKLSINDFSLTPDILWTDKTHRS